MTTGDTKRFELQRELRRVLGDDVADTLMEHLPPGGWGDVARKQDLSFVIETMNVQFDSVWKQFDALRRDLERGWAETQRVVDRVDRVEEKLERLAVVGLGFSLTIVATQIATVIAILLR